jgi:hypothetical protein
MDLGRLPLLERLAPCQRIGLVGAGGGFDILAGVPLFEYLKGLGKTVFLANLSFSNFKQDVRESRSGVVEVRPDTPLMGTYGPERYLSTWYAKRGEDVPVYCFKPMGAVGIRQVYDELVRRFQWDALVLVDGGTDSLMRGDEPGLGTPAEDMCSMAAAYALGQEMENAPLRLLVNLGFGVDRFHGVCHAFVLEAVADLTANGAFLGAFSLLPDMPEFQALVQSLEYVHACMPGQESIVASSVVAAGQGRFGDYHPTARTGDSKLFINPLMAMYWGFELDGVARRCLYLDYLKETYNRWDVDRAIHNYLYTVKSRLWMNIPL